jgi:hypothetical protein
MEVLAPVLEALAAAGRGEHGRERRERVAAGGVENELGGDIFNLGFHSSAYIP